MASTNALILSYVTSTCTLASDLDLGFVQWPHFWIANDFDAANDANPPGSPWCAPYALMAALENVLLAMCPC